MTNEDRIMAEYFDSEALRRSLEQKFKQIAKEYGGSVGLTRAQMEQFLARSGK